MTAFRTIAAATDFSLDGNNAVRRAVRLAQRHGARLTIVHIVDVSAPRPFRDWFAPPIDLTTRFAQARINLHRLAREVIGTRDMPAAVELQVDDRIGALTRVAECSDLLVVGQRAKSPLLDLFRTHTAYRIAEKSRRPVLVVRRAAQSPYRRVLLPVDFTPCSDAAAIVASAVSRETRLEIFHAWVSNSESQLRRAQVSPDIIRQSLEAERRLLVDRMRRKVGELGFDNTDVAFALGRGPAVASILEQTRKRDVDLIVTGRQRRSWLFGAVFGSVSMQLLKETDCDVLIVPNPGFDPLSSRVEALQCPASTTAYLGDARLARHAAAVAGASSGIDRPLASNQSGTVVSMPFDRNGLTHV